MATTCSIPKTNEWVLWAPQIANSSISTGPRLKDLKQNDVGLVLDYTGGGPEYPPCIVVAWQLKFTDNSGYWWYVSKHPPDELRPYDYG